MNTTPVIAPANISNFALKAVDRVIYAEVFPEHTKPRSLMRARSILEAAIASYRLHGIENTTYERIAEKAAITRPLIFKYFANYDEIFFKSVKLIRVHQQVFTAQAIRKHSSPTAKITAFVEATFGWLDLNPSYASTLFLYLQRCSWNETDRALNTQFNESARSRISAMIRLGVQAGEFACTNPDVMAKQVQTVMLGALLASSSETQADSAGYRSDVLALCLGLVGLRPLV